MKLIYWDDFSLGLAPLIIIYVYCPLLLLSIGLMGEYIVAILAYNKIYLLLKKKNDLNNLLTLLGKFDPSLSP